MRNLKINIISCNCFIVMLTLLYSGNTGFLLAAQNGHLNILEFLLTKGSSVDEKNDWGMIKLLFIYLSKIPLWLKLFTAFIYLSIHMSSYWLIIYKSIYTSFLSIYLSIYLIVFVYIQYIIIVFRWYWFHICSYLSIIYLYLSIHPSIIFSIYLFNCMCLYLIYNYCIQVLLV